ncbi:MAG: DUF5985 family protein [Candidatus Binatia bacterium]
MAESVYLLCALTSAGCAALLLRRWADSGARLLLWTSLCFVALALNNSLLFADLVLVPGMDLSTWRNAVAVAGILVLLHGLIWDAR